MDKRIGAAEAAQRLGISMSTLARWRKAGRIPCVRAWSGAHPQYREADVEALLVPNSAGDCRKRKD